MMLSQAILPPQFLHLNRKHRILFTTSLNCRRKIIPSRIMSSSQAALPPTVGNFSFLPKILANCEEVADVYEQLNRNITMEILKTKLGFSSDEIRRLTGDEISNIMIAECFTNISRDELHSIVKGEIYKLPEGKRNRFVKAHIVREYPFAKFFVSLFLPTDPREEEEEKIEEGNEPVPSAAHHFSAPLPPQQTRCFPLSKMVPLGLTCVFGILGFIGSKMMKKGGHPITPAIDVAHDLQLVETDNQVGSVEATSNYSLAKCLAALEEIEDISDDTCGKALKKFMNPDSRKMFIAMSNESKREWLLQL